MAISRSIILTITFYIIGFPTYSQATSGKITGYKDFILVGNQVFLLTNSGEINRVDLTSGKIIGQIIKRDAPIIAIAKDRAGNLVVADTAHTIQRYDRVKASWHTLFTYDGKLTGLTFDATNQCFAIINTGIVCINEGKRYFPDSALFLNDQIRNKTSWFETPTFLMDKHDRIWIGFDYGEWGGDIFAFDTQKRVYSRLRIDSVQSAFNPVRSLCEGPKSIYVSGSLSHLMLTHGSIIKFDDLTASVTLVSEDRETPERVTSIGPDGKKKLEIWTILKGGHQIGPIAYNSANGCLYFYSQYGIFRGSTSSNLSDIKQWQNILKPKLQWTGGRSNAAGPAMNVLKMQFTSNGTLLFLTEHDGIGVYADKTLRFIK